MQKLLWGLAGAGLAAGAVWLALREQPDNEGASFAIRRAISLEVSPQAAYQLWRDPATHARIREGVTVSAAEDGRIWHWERTVRGGMQVAWESEFTHEEPGVRLEWAAHGDQPLHFGPWLRPSEGMAQFRWRASGEGCELRLSLVFAGRPKLPWAAAAIEHGMDRTLRRFRQLAETGELATTHGQPAAGARAQPAAREARVA